MPDTFEEIVNQLVTKQGQFSASEAGAAARITRQAAHRRLRRMVADGVLSASGEARARRYTLKVGSREDRRFRTAGLQEHEVWQQIAQESAALRNLSAGSTAILRYAFTEILNNAIDHSGAPVVDVGTQRIDELVRVEIVDQGVGIFEQIKRAYRLADRLEALAELQKGKVTTKPRRHSGEGIFFVSKAVDFFEIDSGGILWQVDNVRDDVAVGQGGLFSAGTRVRFDIRSDRTDALEDIFAPFTTDFEFDRTRTLVRLFTLGKEFVSRSEAKRLTAGLEKFREVVLDFDRVESIGQGFADEVFRVWAGEHPDVHLEPVNMNQVVAFMLKRAGGGASTG